MTQFAKPATAPASTDGIWRDIPAPYAYAIAAALGMALFFWFYPLEFFLGHSTFFDSSDPAQHVAGWRYYARDAWHFPLLHTSRLNAPSGVSIAFTDSIPLAALLFKPFVPWLPEGFHYFGLWHGLTYLTQALAAAFLLRAFGVKHLPGLLAAVMLSIVWPALLWRLAHTSLMTQSLILAALGCYVRAVEARWAPSRAAAGMLGTSFLALMIHPYLFAMVYALFLMFLLEMAVRLGRRMWLRAALLLGLSLAGTLAIAAVLGYLGHSSASDGFGLLSMNLLAPVCGGSIYPCAILAPGGPQGEGVNYLGAGLLLMMLVVAATRRADAVRLLRAYPVLLVGLAGMTVYALSNRIIADSTLLFTYPVPPFLTTLVNTFRASGRFFWPVGYALLFFTLALLLRRPARWTLPVLAVALVVQWIDMSPYRDNVRHYTRLAHQDDMRPWQNAMKGVKQINVYPAYGCDTSSETIYSFFQRLGGWYGTTMNTGHVARYIPDCPLSKSQFDTAFAPDQLYVMAARHLADPGSIRGGFREALAAGQCGIWQEAVICRSGEALADWGTALALMPADVSVLRQRSHWDGAALPTLIGKPAGTRMVTPEPNVTGMLSYGPYVELLPGRYRFSIHYQGDAPPERVLGKWDVQYMHSSTQFSEMASGMLIGTDGKPGLVGGILEVPIGHTGRWEIRTVLNGQGDVQLISLDIEHQ